MDDTHSVCAAALMIAGSIFVYAQQGPGEPGVPGRRERGRGWRLSVIRRTGPRLPMRASRRFMQNSNSTQIGKNWPAFEQALRELTQLRADRFAHNQQPSSDPVMRLQRLADALTVRGAALKRLAVHWRLLSEPRRRTDTPFYNTSAVHDDRFCRAVFRNAMDAVASRHDARRQ